MELLNGMTRLPPGVNRRPRAGHVSRLTVQRPALWSRPCPSEAGSNRANDLTFSAYIDRPSLLSRSMPSFSTSRYESGRIRTAPWRHS